MLKGRLKLFVVAKCAQTLDGKIATASGESKWITSEATRSFARRKRDQFDAILVGLNTVLKDNPALNATTKKSIKKVILDSGLKISIKARLFQGVDPKNCIIATTKKASESRIKLFMNQEIQVIVCPAKSGRVDLKSLFQKLSGLGIKKLLIEGGANVVGSALKANLVDQLHIYVAPKILGDQHALTSIVGINIRSLSRSIELKDIQIKKINQDIFIQGNVYRNR